MSTEKKLEEDGVSMVGGSPVNNVGGGEIAGLGVGAQGEPGVKKTKRKVMPLMAFVRRKAPVTK
jgi:hypothetical protein